MTATIQPQQKRSTHYLHRVYCKRCGAWIRRELIQQETRVNQNGVVVHNQCSTMIHFTALKPTLNHRREDNHERI